jgi:hypothetical protein
MIFGVRDGMIRGRIRSRWHRDGRELSGNAALWYGAITSIVGAMVVAAALWLILTPLWG